MASHDLVGLLHRVWQHVEESADSDRAEDHAAFVLVGLDPVVKAC